MVPYAKKIIHLAFSFILGLFGGVIGTSSFYKIIIVHFNNCHFLILKFDLLYISKSGKIKNYIKGCSN